jgi:hypothetical protein
VQGTVGEPHPSQWNTPSGSLPPDTTIHTVSSDALIFTDTPINVERYLKGSAPGDVVLVCTIGGVVGQDKMFAEHAPELQPGKRLILLLAPDDNPRTRNIGPNHYIVVWGFEDVYEVVGDRAISETHQLPLADLYALIELINR